MTPLELEWLASSFIGCLCLGWIVGKQFLMFKKSMEIIS